MPDNRVLTVAQAICEATDICLERDEHVFVIGEGVTDPKAIFGTVTGLAEKYGPDRIVEMPVAENGLTGVAIGAAMLGRRPILVHQRVDFALLSLEQLFNNAAKTHYVTGGRHRVPLVVRMVIGRGWGQGPEHSQSMEAVFAHIPGLKVVMPSTPRQAKGLLIAAIEDDNPVVFIEHRWVHYATGHVPEGHYLAPLSGPAMVRAGRDLTLVATAYGLFEALQAADALAESGIEAEVFDMQVLRPLDVEPIAESVRRTGRLMVVDTGWRTYGPGAEIAARITESCFAHLKAPPVRLGLPDHPTPSSRALVENYYPHAGMIVERLGAMMPDALARLAPVRETLAAARAKTMIDVPNPLFRGPF
jgi:acetoin:2,6-dichlorophenolindophenol oxidoreductase subunit beta